MYNCERPFLTVLAMPWPVASTNYFQVKSTISIEIFYHIFHQKKTVKNFIFQKLC